LLKAKRKFPDVMRNAEQRIEKWRASLLESIHPHLDVAIFLLVCTTGARLGLAASKLVPQHVSELHTLTRRQLFALQFALSGMKGELPQGKFVEDLVRVSPEVIKRAYKALEHMYAYSLARDAFLTYAWGGYELADSTENLLLFVDSPDWRGGRDRADQIISKEIEDELARSPKVPLVLPPQLMLERSVEVPPSLPLDGLTAAEFVSAWKGPQAGLILRLQDRTKSRNGN
jgi:hypothetical protein